LINGNNVYGTAIYLSLALGDQGLFWQDLSQDGLIEGSYPNGGATSLGCSGNASGITNTTSPSIGNYLPPAQIGNGNFVYIYTYNGINWFGLSALTQLTASYSAMSTGNIPVSQAYSIDQKIDDGIPTTGAVQAIFPNSPNNGAAAPVQANNAASDGDTTCYNTGSSPPAYSIKYDNGALPNCGLSFKFQGGE
jgi:hypothetical protein